MEIGMKMQLRGGIGEIWGIKSRISKEVLVMVVLVIELEAQHNNTCNIGVSQVN